jgi:flagellar hook-associated protein 3 FlgL
MVTRVTNQSMQANALSNIFRITEGLAKASQEIASGKRVNRPSDDPAGIRDALGLRSAINQTKQFGRNIDFNKLYLSNGDSALDTVGLNLTRARELTLSQVAAPGTAQTRTYVKSEISQILSAVLQEANASVKNQYIFSGSRTRTAPFALSGANEVDYLGDTRAQAVEIAKGVKVNLNLPGSEVFTADLNPAVTGATLLSNLNGGAGIPAGTFSITNRIGASANITVAAGMTVNNLISAINSSGLNVTAAINSDKMGLTLTDNNSVVTRELTVADLGGGKTASALGIVGGFDSNIQGNDLNPTLTATTQLSDLKGGNGLTLSAIQIVNGSASGTVTLSTAVTVGDVINLINASGFNVTAAINGKGNALRVTSNNSSTVAVVMESGNGTSAQDLGIGGGGNIFTTLINLQDALGKNDVTALHALLKNLEQGGNTVNNGRATLGAVSRRLDATKTVNDKSAEDFTKGIAEIEDADLVKSASDLALLQNALQATLSSTARIIQPSLMNFLS